MERAIDASELMAEIQVCSWDSEQDRERAEDLVLGMPTLTPPNEWVSVEERLPEAAGEYLVVYHPCHWDAVSEKVCVGIDTFRGKTAWAKKKYQRVTHWMTLPAPPDRRPPEGEADA